MSGPEDTARESPWRDRILGIVVAIATILVGQLVVVLIASLTASAGRHDGGWTLLLLALNPGVSAVLFGAPVAFFLRKRRQALMAHLVTLGLVVLLNGACWGVLTRLG